ncbi:MAG: acetylglutamate kinase [Armatimonadetes bacterium 13_1_40CM_3_65_7]|nr:MAG: acetylglutamate kinase [Armatimonadetes bacterium 13_1_40CM_3_65_7]
MIVVVKVGGASLGAAAKIAALRARGNDVVAVHGAGPQISARCREAGIEPRFVGGLRVTDAAVLGIVEEAVAAENDRLCGELEAAGVNARPMRDALIAEPWADRALGLVGQITSVEQIGIRALLASGIVPVIPPTACGLNVNADHVAAAVAGALRASELVFLSDVPGVLDGDGRVLRRLSATSVPALISAGHVTGGMIPKLDAGLAALTAGVWRVWIGAETMVTA